MLFYFGFLRICKKIKGVSSKYYLDRPGIMIKNINLRVLIYFDLFLFIVTHFLGYNIIIFGLFEQNLSNFVFS